MLVQFLVIHTLIAHLADKDEVLEELGIAFGDWVMVDNLGDHLSNVFTSRA